MIQLILTNSGPNILGYFSDLLYENNRLDFGQYKWWCDFRYVTFPIENNYIKPNVNFYLTDGTRRIRSLNQNPN